MNYFNEQSDEPLYELVAKELAHSPRQGLLIKCMAKSEGIESKAKAMYIKVRVSEMKVEIKQRVKKEEADQREAKKNAVEEFNLDDQNNGYFIIGGFILLVGVFLYLFWLDVHG